MLVKNKRIQFCGEQKFFNYTLVIHTKQVATSPLAFMMDTRRLSANG